MSGGVGPGGLRVESYFLLIIFLLACVRKGVKACVPYLNFGMSPMGHVGRNLFVLGKLGL